MPHAITELAAQMNDSDVERVRSAQRDLWQQVRHTGRPGADQERADLVAQLMSLLQDDQTATVRREVLWMLSEIGGDESVERIGALLQHPELREDARMTLQRIPGDTSLAALQTALQSAPDDFKLNLAQSLRARGAEVSGLPCEKLKPTRPTQVKPVGRTT